MYNADLEREIKEALKEFPQLNGGKRRRRGGMDNEQNPVLGPQPSSSAAAAAAVAAPSQTRAALRQLANDTITALENTRENIDAAVANVVAHIPTIAATSGAVAIASRPSILANIVGLVSSVANSIPSLGPGFGNVADGTGALIGQSANLAGTAGSYITTPSGIMTLALFIYKRRAQANGNTLAQQATADTALLAERARGSLRDFAERQIAEFNAVIAAANQDAIRQGRNQLRDALGHLPRHTLCHNHLYLLYLLHFHLLQHQFLLKPLFQPMKT